jgi:hypothetical protein
MEGGDNDIDQNLVPIKLKISSFLAQFLTLNTKFSWTEATKLSKDSFDKLCRSHPKMNK